jgi:hypothetical protein
MWWRFAIGAFLNLKFLPIPLPRNALRNAVRRAPAHQLRKLSKSSITRFTGFTDFFTSLGSDNSHVFKCLSTKMAVSTVSDPESEQELADSESHQQIEFLLLAIIGYYCDAIIANNSN